GQTVPGEAGVPGAMSAPGVDTLAEHQLEPALDLLVARLLQGRQGALLVEELLAAHLAAPADLTAFLDQRPAAQQVRLQHQLDEARRLGPFGALLKEQSHAADCTACHQAPVGAASAAIVEPIRASRHSIAAEAAPTPRRKSPWGTKQKGWQIGRA